MLKGVKLMKENEFFKKSIEENIIDKEEVLMKVIEENRKQKKGSWRPGYLKVATTLAVTTAILGVAMFSPIHKPKNNNVAGVGQEIKGNKFSIIAYAAEFEKEGTLRKIEDSLTLLKTNAKTELPIGNIILGDYMEETLDDGSIFQWYDNSFTSEGGFLCEGEGIDSVTFTSENGNFSYFDVEKLKEKENSGEVFKVEMNIPRNDFSNEKDIDSVIENFYNMWNEGLLDEYKNKYFKGEDLIEEIKSGKYGIGIRDNVENDYLTIRITGDFGEDVSKAGQSITVKSGQEVSYIPQGAIDQLSKTGNPNFEELPKDNIKVEVKFKDGEVVTSNVELSFNKGGRLVGELKE